MKLRYLIPFLFLLACSSEQRPNIVIFIADDVSWNDLGCYGSKAVVTPQIDLIASEGLIFQNAFLTTSSCSPSRASILSGRYPHNTGAPELHMPVPAHIGTIAGQLKNSGYFTASSGKWHLGEAKKADFDRVIDQDFGWGGEDRWLEALDACPNGQPFFLWLAAIDAHRDWDENRDFQLSKIDNVNVPPYLIDDSVTRNDLRQYFNEIARFDYHIGTVLERLREMKQLENTIVVVMADNGRPFPRDKTRLYDDGIKTPLIIKWGEELAKGSSKSLVSAVDLAPTLAQLAGLAPLESYQGKSFVPTLIKPTQKHRNYVFAEKNWHDFEGYERMVRTADYLFIYNGRSELAQSGAADTQGSDAFRSLIKAKETGKLTDTQHTHFLAPRPTEELYNVKRDRQQIQNLINEGDLIDVTDSLRMTLLKWQIETGDTKPENLTPHHYDFLTVRNLVEGRHFLDITRGEFPGQRSGADQINRPGPF